MPYKHGNNPLISSLNSTSVVLASGATFTGEAEDVSNYTSVTTSIKVDKDGTLYIEFSVDGSNWDTSLSYNILANMDETHGIAVSRKFYRVRFTNTSVSTQGFLRLQSIYGERDAPNSTLNSIVHSNSDSIVTRSIVEESLIAEGKYIGRSIFNRLGQNPDVDIAATPEDVWNGGGVYTGFPTGAAEEFEAFSSSASDTGILTITYLASATATAYQSVTITLNGTTPVGTGITGIRVQSAIYNSGSPTASNLGAITVRHKVTTTNIFCVIVIGNGQSMLTSFTIPYGSVGYIKRLFCRVIGNVTVSINGSLWYRESGTSPRLRRPFTATNATSFEEHPYGGLAAPALTDINMRITTVSSNNCDIVAGYDLLLVSNL